MIDRAIQLSECLGNASFQSVFDQVAVDDCKEACTTAPRRLKQNMTALCDTAANLLEFTDYIKANATKAMQRVTSDNITADGKLIDCVIENHVTYLGDKNLTETCLILQDAQNISDTYNANILKLFGELNQNVTEGIEHLQNELVNVTASVHQWSHNAKREETERRLNIIAGLTELFETFVGRVDALVDTGLEVFADNVMKAALDAQQSFEYSVGNLTEVQTKLAMKADTVEIKRPIK